jgi:hypothetical protein
MPDYTGCKSYNNKWRQNYRICLQSIGIYIIINTITNTKSVNISVFLSMLIISVAINIFYQLTYTS